MCVYTLVTKSHTSNYHFRSIKTKEQNRQKQTEQKHYISLCCPYFPELDMLLNPSLVFAGTVCSAAWAHWPLYCQTAFVPVISGEPYTPPCMCVFIVSIALCIVYFVYFPALYCIIIYMAYCIVLYCIVWWMICALLHCIFYCIFVM